MSLSTEVIVIGAGVVGLAVAERLTRAGKEVILVEKEREIGTHTSSRNSEVIHAGIYYPPGSLKASLCRQGRDQLYDYCQQHKVDFKQTGKFVIATHPDQHSRLADIQTRAANNDVALTWVDKAEITAQYPDLKCSGGLYSPLSGIIDSHALMLSLRGRFEGHSGTLALQTRVTHIDWRNNRFQLSLALPDETRFSLSAHHIINCAGLDSWAVADKMPVAHVPPKYLAKGHYYKPAKSLKFEHLIYPLPTPGGLGVHITRDLAGQIKFGPDVKWISQPDYSMPATAPVDFYDAIACYFPSIKEIGLTPDYCGIRPKCDKHYSDFIFQHARFARHKNIVNCFGIESPGLTSCLAIADHIYQALWP